MSGIQISGGIEQVGIHLCIHGSSMHIVTAKILLCV